MCGVCDRSLLLLRELSLQVVVGLEQSVLVQRPISLLELLGDGGRLRVYRGGILGDRLVNHGLLLGLCCSGDGIDLCRSTCLVNGISLLLLGSLLDCLGGFDQPFGVDRLCSCGACEPVRSFDMLCEHLGAEDTLS